VRQKGNKRFQVSNKGNARANLVQVSQKGNPDTIAMFSSDQNISNNHHLGDNLNT
jgi:hypothetical protein